MASTELPPCKKRPAPTTICALGDDLLCEVFLRLPSLPSLVRAALICPAFLRAARSSPKFRRRFRELHPAPLLGIFLDIYEPSMPAFVPIRRPSDLDHAAAVRGADVFLTRVPDVGDNRVPGDEEEEEDDTDDDDDDSPGWSMTQCRNGYVVLVSRTADQLIKGVAVYDPLTRGLHLLPALPEEIYGDPEETEVEFHVDTPKEDRRLLRVVCVCKETMEVRVAFLSPDSREWQISPETARLQLNYYGEGNGTAVNGSVYWASESGIQVLNMATLTFSRIDPPPHMGEGSKIGETSDGKLCIAFETDIRLCIWVLKAATNSADKWMRKTTFKMRQAICELELQFVDELDVLGLGVVAIINGTVYLTIFVPSLPSSSGWFLSFCIETKKLKKVCPITRSESSYPYAMAWPPVLVGN